MSRKNSVLGLSVPENAEFLDNFIQRAFEISCSAELNTKKSFITWGPELHILITLYNI